jgi:hypothetical protein
MHGEVVGSAVTGSDGAYACDGMISGACTLVATAEHSQPTAATLTVPAEGELRHDVELELMAALVGAVRADGRMVSDAQVTVLDEAGGLVATARTDADGGYHVPGLPAGNYVIVARGYPPLTSKVTVSGNESRHDVHLGYDAAPAIR